MENLAYRLLNRIDRTKAWELFFKRLNKYNIRLKGYPAFEMSDYFKIVDKAEPGNQYIFLSTDSKSISSIAIKKAVKFNGKPGYFSHAGLIFLNGDRKTSIMHIMEAGLIEQPLIDFLKQVDYFCVIKLPVDKKDELMIENRIKLMRNRSNLIKYDWEEQLDNGENLLYCSELIYVIYKDLVNTPNFKPRKILGRYIFDPNLLLECGEIIYNNHPKIDNVSYADNIIAHDIELLPELI